MSEHNKVMSENPKEETFENIKTTDLEDPENFMIKLSVFALIHLSKIGVIYLGTDQKLVRDIAKYKVITIKQKAEIARITSFQVKRLGGLKDFNSTLKKLS